MLEDNLPAVQLRLRWLQAQFVYLAVMLDGFSRKVVALGTIQCNFLPTAALEKALVERKRLCQDWSTSQIAVCTTLPVNT